MCEVDDTLVLDHLVHEQVVDPIALVQCAVDGHLTTLNLQHAGIRDVGAAVFELEHHVDFSVIAENAEAWAEFVAADDPKQQKKKSGFLIGQVMRATNGQADGKALNQLIAQRRAAAK